MIDFQNKSFMKMKQDSSFAKKAQDLLAHGEDILDSYKSMRDGVVFTTMRIIIINVQGLTGKKVDYTSIPYKRINVYSIETAGNFDLDAELDIFISGIGKLRFEFRGKSDIREISRYISQAII